jgi:hypothetical protein
LNSLIPKRNDELKTYERKDREGKREKEEI